MTPDNSPEVTTSSDSHSYPTPWNPKQLFYFGLVLGPIWAIVMSVLNARRCGRSPKVWSAVGIVMAMVILFSIVAGPYPEETPTSQLNWGIKFGIFHLATLWLVWKSLLQPQMNGFATATSGHSEANMVWPGVLGVLLCGFPLWTFVAIPTFQSALFQGQSPRQICKAFMDADKSDKQREICTLNMYPLIDYLQADEETEADPDVFQYELSNESFRPVGLSGATVGIRTRAPDGFGKHIQMDGFFHLVNLDGHWKIEEWYLTSFNQQPLAVGRIRLLDAIRSAELNLQQLGAQVGQFPDYTEDSAPLPIQRVTPDSSQPMSGRATAQASQAIYKAGEMGTQMTPKAMRKGVEGVFAIGAFLLGCLYGLGKLLRRKQSNEQPTADLQTAPESPSGSVS
ncbi:hypothetical protein [Lacunimicrobium album]